MVDISIIIPIYNVEAYLDVCLTSIVNQPCKRVEIIMVNDGSTDGSVAIAEKFVQQYGNDLKIILVTQVNGGLSAARNTGMLSASGKYIWFVDSDDWIMDGAIKELIQVLESSDSDIILFDFERIYDNKIEYVSSGSFENHQSFNSVVWLKGVLLNKIPIAAWNLVIRRQILEQTGYKFPLGKWYEDISLTQLYIYNTQLKITKINEALYKYRQRSGSITKIISPKILHRVEEVEEVEQYLIKGNLYTSYREEYASFVLKIACIQVVNTFIRFYSYENREKINNWIAIVINNPTVRKSKRGYLTSKCLTLKDKAAIFMIFNTIPLYRFLYLKLFQI